MFGTGKRHQVARIGGIPIYVSTSWLFVAVLFAFGQYTALSQGAYADEALGATALVFALFFGGILLHEAAHAIAGRAFGLPVRGITLVFWGGATEVRSWRKGPFADFVVAAVGPATTAFLGFLFLFLADQMGPGSTRSVMQYLGRLNLLFAVFNVLPGFPLDGGRMLLTAAWGITRNRILGLRVAGIGAVLIGGGMLAWAVANFGSTGGGTLFLGYIGFVLLSSGLQIPKAADLRGKLSYGAAADAMRPTAPDGRSFDRESAVRTDDPLDTVVEWLSDGACSVTDATGELRGVITLDDVQRWLERHWSTGEFVTTPSVVPPRPDGVSPPSRT
jgi:Zn-dependent protease